MTLNRLVRNLAVGAVLYAGCGDGDKTTVNNYSSRDGGVQSQGSGGSSVSREQDIDSGAQNLDGGVQNLDEVVLVKEALCRIICSDPNCTEWYLKDQEGYGSADFECEPICYRTLTYCGYIFMTRLLDCFEQYTCRERGLYPGETPAEYIETRTEEENSCYLRTASLVWIRGIGARVDTLIPCLHDGSYIDENGRHIQR